MVGCWKAELESSRKWCKLFCFLFIYLFILADRWKWRFKTSQGDTSYHTLPSVLNPVCQALIKVQCSSYTKQPIYRLMWMDPIFRGGSSGKESACNVGDTGFIPGSGRSPGEGNSYPLQYSCLENPMDRGAWWVTAHGVAKSWKWLTYSKTTTMLIYGI